MEERRNEGNQERERNKLWRLLYQNHLSLRDSLLFNREKLTLFGRSVIATPPPSNTPQTKGKSWQLSSPSKKQHTSEGRDWQQEAIQIEASEAENVIRLKEKAKHTLQGLLDCMPDNDGSLPVNDIQLSAKERTLSIPTRKESIEVQRKSLSRHTSGVVLPRVLKYEDDAQLNQPEVDYRSTHGRSRLDPGFDTYIPPKVLSLRINRPETVPGRFSKIKINDDFSDQSEFRNVIKETEGNELDKTNGTRDEPVGDSTEADNEKEGGDVENMQEKEGGLAVPTSSGEVTFKSASVSDRGLKVVPIHKIKHQTAPLITEEQIQEMKTLRQKYLSKKVSGGFQHLAIKFGEFSVENNRSFHAVLTCNFHSRRTVYLVFLHIVQHD